MKLALRPSGPLRATLRVPGDKSITHRALLFAAWAEGESVVRGANPGADCAHMASALRGLGADVQRAGVWPHPGQPAHDAAAPPEPDDPPRFVVRGVAGTWHEPARVLDLGNSGTAMRLLAGAVAGAPVFCVLDGDDSLRRRPMGRVSGPLRRMGAVIEGRAGGEFAPLALRGRALHGIRHVSPVASAQVKSAVLLAGLAAEGETWVVEPRRSRDHTERMLPAYGARLLAPHADPAGGLAVGLAGPQQLAAADVEVPGDFSAAAFWIVAALVVPGSEVTIENVSLNPTRTGLLRALARMGARVEAAPTGERAGEPMGTVRARYGPLAATGVTADELPDMIDEVPIWAVACAFATGTSTLGGGSELRAKESDRLAGVVRGLRDLGLEAEERGDGLAIHGTGASAGGGAVPGGKAASLGDHRLAMAFLVAGLGSRDGVEVTGCETVDTSYPGFYSCATALASFR